MHGVSWRLIGLLANLNQHGITNCSCLRKPPTPPPQMPYTDFTLCCPVTRRTNAATDSSKNTACQIVASHSIAAFSIAVALTATPHSISRKCERSSVPCSQEPSACPLEPDERPPRLPFCLFVLYFIIFLPSTLWFQPVSFPRVCQPTTLHLFVFSVVRSTFPVHFILLQLLTRRVCGGSTSCITEAEWLRQLS